jgi:hypothetical protein
MVAGTRTQKNSAKGAFLLRTQFPCARTFDSGAQAIKPFCNIGLEVRATTLMVNTHVLGKFATLLSQGEILNTAKFGARCFVLMTVKKALIFVRVKTAHLEFGSDMFHKANYTVLTILSPERE